MNTDVKVNEKFWLSVFSNSGEIWIGVKVQYSIVVVNLIVHAIKIICDSCLKYRMFLNKS